MKNVKLKYILFSFFILTLLSSCAKVTTKQEAFPYMYEERPLSILVLSPINLTTAADAKEYYSTTIAEPLSFAGYYVYPMEVVSDILKSEGLYDTELLVNLPPEKFKQFFGADAVLYVKLLKWDTSYYVLGGSVTVSVDFMLKSTATGKVLWKYDGTIMVDTTGDSHNVPGMAGLFVKLLSTAIKTATTDYVPLARQANRITISTLPYGKYHLYFDKDKNFQILDKREQE